VRMSVCSQRFDVDHVAKKVGRPIEGGESSPKPNCTRVLSGALPVRTSSFKAGPVLGMGVFRRHGRLSRWMPRSGPVISKQDRLSRPGACRIGCRKVCCANLPVGFGGRSESITPACLDGRVALIKLRSRSSPRTLTGRKQFREPEVPDLFFGGETTIKKTRVGATMSTGALVRLSPGTVGVGRRFRNLSGSTTGGNTASSTCSSGIASSRKKSPRPKSVQSPARP